MTQKKTKNNNFYSWLASLVLTIIFTLIMSVFFYQNDIFNLKIILIFSLLVFITSLVIINFYVEKNIYKRVEKIYKNIMVLESKSTPVQNVPISNDMDFLENEINRYAKLKKLEVQSFKEREEFRKEFVGNVAHELKTPLFTVQGYISTLLDGAMDNQEILKKGLLSINHALESLMKKIERVIFDSKLPNQQDICPKICYTFLYGRLWLTCFKRKKKLRNIHSTCSTGGWNTPDNF